MKYGHHLREIAAEESEWGDTPQRVRERVLRAEADNVRLTAALRIACRQWSKPQEAFNSYMKMAEEEARS